MDRIIDILAWPVTTVIVVLLLRTPIKDLIATLKKLKYKDLEIEFEKEANKILANIERDLPEPPKNKDGKGRSDNTLARLAEELPAAIIMNSWRQLELRIRELSNQDKNKTSIGKLVRELAASDKISNETAKIILELSTLRNKAAHTHNESLNYVTASLFKESISRVLSTLKLESEI